MEMPEIIKAIRTTDKGGFWDKEYIQTAYPEHESTYHHSRIVEAIRRENEELKAKLDKANDALEQISRMSPLPDHKINTITLVACREIASVALGNKSIVHALRKHKAMNSIYPDAPEQP